MPDVAVGLLEAGACLLDVRDEAEWAHARITGALHIPMDELSERLAEVPTDRPVIVMCAAGARSQSAAQWLQAQGRDAANLAYGIRGWHAMGLPIER